MMAVVEEKTVVKREGGDNGGRENNGRDGGEKETVATMMEPTMVVKNETIGKRCW